MKEYEKMTKDKLHTYGINRWEEEFLDIYRDQDPYRTPAEMWLLLVEDASKVAEFLRRGRYTQALTPLAHVFCWTCSFTWRCRSESELHCEIQNPLSAIVWNKYPDRCPHCGEERCICPVWRLEREELPEDEKKLRENRVEETLKLARVRVEKMPKSLDGLENMFKRIYKGAHYALSIEAIGLHFMEEVGEVSTCIRELRERESDADVEKLKNNLESEIADIVSWVMSLVSKLDYILGSGTSFLRGLEAPQKTEKEEFPSAGLRLSEVVWRAYQTPDGNTLYCPTCEHRPCTLPLKEKRKKKS